MKIHIKKGDKVEVVAGASKGKQGTVTQVIPATYRAIIEGVNMVKKHLKPTNNNPGGIEEMEAPIHISNLMLVDPKSNKPTRVGKAIKDGVSVRVSKKSGEIIK